LTTQLEKLATMDWAKRILSLSIRAFALAARLLLSLFLAKYLTLEEVGQFGLVSALTIGGPAILGFGLNYFANREIALLNEPQSTRRIRDRLAISCSTYLLVALTIIPLAKIAHGASTSLAILIASVFAIESILMDFHYSLIALQRAVAANFLTFLRSAVWVYPFMIAAYSIPTLRNIDALLMFWACGLTAGSIYAYAQLCAKSSRSLKGEPVDLKWFSQFWRKSKLVYLSDIAIFIFAFSDRFVLGTLVPMSVLGGFIFYSTVANAVQLLASAAIVQTITPILIKHAEGRDAAQLKAFFLNELRNALLLAAALSGLIFILSKPLIEFLGKKTLAEYHLLLPILLVTAVLKVGSDMFSQLLYALRRDQQWAVANIGAATSFVLLAMAFAKPYGVYGVAYSALGAALIAFVARAILCKNAIRTQRAVN
jgi:O-antigen/teichoic acid export membrane protein